MSKKVLIFEPYRIALKNVPLVYWLQATLDIGLITGLLYLNMMIKGIPFNTEYRILAILTILLMVIIYRGADVYSVSRSLVSRVLAIGSAWCMVLIIIISITFATKTSATYSREVYVLWFVTGFVAQLVSYLVVRVLVINTRHTPTPTLIIGTEKLAEQLWRSISQTPGIADDIVGFVAEGGTTKTDGERDIPILGDIDLLEKFVGDHKIKRVYLALPITSAQKLNPICSRLAALNVDIKWAQDIFGIGLKIHGVHDLAGLPVFSLSDTQVPLLDSQNSKFSNQIKRVIDLIIAMTLLIALSPIILISALLVVIFEGFPILYVSQRHISVKKTAKIYKYRTMVKDATSPKYRLAELYLKDGYLDIPLSSNVYTAIGRFLEKSQIVESLQLLNILKDGMSFVGNRPLPAENLTQLKQFTGWEERFSSPAGITGISQVVGKFNLTAEDRIELERMYSALYCSPTGNILVCDLLLIYYTLVFIITGVPLSKDRATKILVFSNHGKSLL